jgi:DNA polymerase III delta prime subunit
MDDHKKILEDLNKQSIEHLQSFLKKKEGLKEEDHKKIAEAQKEWQEAWNKLINLAVVLDSFEI